MTRPVFRKSTYSSDSWNCVEVALVDGHVVVRDSNHPDGPTITYSGEDWETEVVDEIKEGGWLPGWTYRTDDERVVVRRERATAGVTFSEDDWEAFVDGVLAGEFDLERLATEPTAIEMGSER